MTKKEMMRIADFFQLFHGRDPELTMEEAFKLTKLRSLEDCKRYMKVMLDFYFDVIQSPAGRKYTTAIEDDRNIWLQQIFILGCNFHSLLDGIGYQKGCFRINPVIDPGILFTVARRIYESVVVFYVLFIHPKTKDHQTILYNLFRAHGLSERLKDIDEDTRKKHPERIEAEKADITACKTDIINCPLYQKLNQETKNNIENAFGKRFRYTITDDNLLKRYGFEDAYQILGLKKELFESLYSFYSLHGHPSFLSICQFRDAFKDEFRADHMMAVHAAQCTISIMSVFIIDYMKLNKEVKAMYDQMSDPKRFVIGMYEDALRGEHKFK